MMLRSCCNAAHSDESECWQGSSGLDLVVVLFALQNKLKVGCEKNEQ